MKQTLQNLRERPRDEKTTIAASVALGVVAVLFLGWLVYFIHVLTSNTAPNIPNATGSLDTGSVPSLNLEQAYGSTTQFIESATGTIQLEQVSSTSEPSL